MKAVVFGSFQSLYKYQQAFSPILFLFVIWGFMRRKGLFCPWRQNLFVLSFALFFFILIFPLFLVHGRYTSHMIPIALPWAAYGFLGVTEAIRSWDKVRKYSEKTICIILFLIMAGLLAQGIVQRNKRAYRVVQKQAGLWLKHNLSRGEKLMARTVQEAFYANMERVYMPEGDFEYVIEAARSQSVRYVIVGEKGEEYYPNFLEKAERQGLVPIHSWEKGKLTIFLFEIVGLPSREQKKPVP